MAVTIAVNADAGNHVEFDTSVSKLNKRPIANAASQIREENVVAANRTQLGQEFLVFDRQLRVGRAN